MNVGELIEKLKQYPQDLRVVVNGYEGGYSDIDRFENLKIVLDYHKEWYYGKHESADYLRENSEHLKSTAVDALCVG